ncbi:AGAP000783-PA-like protein [Anopheles sinensis]|uniref:AGAP000783-PA-like protein n=1 Tax=Anopheles sinensis TaxID=74873 RepID=A0A084VJC7_ANOSI|nr:AGAP000783-PA-like protein [Anopheles sinensis]
MSKWSKPQGVVVPLESLLKERRKENCPAPRRSAGLVGRWGITSFTSIRNRGYVIDYGNVNPKEPGLELGSGAADSSDAISNMLGSSVEEPARPRKFFKSRNTVLPPPMPPGDLQQHVGFVPHSSPFEVAQGALATDMWNHSSTTPPQHFYQQHQLPLSAATPQVSPTGPQSANVSGLLHAGTTDGMITYGAPQPPTLPIQPVKEKAPRKKKRASSEVAACEPVACRKQVGRPPSKKEKKEKKPKRARKETTEVGSIGGISSALGGTEAGESQPKRNSSRIRNRVINYNEDEDDSNDYERARTVTSRAQPTQNTTADPGFTPDSSSLQAASKEYLPRQPSSGDGDSESLSSKPTIATSCLPSPSISEHRPILLRISKGTSMLITDNEELPCNNQQQQQQQQLVPDEDVPPGIEVNSSESLTTLKSSGGCLKTPQHTGPAPSTQEDNLFSARPVAYVSSCAAGSDAGSVSKSELKIKISLGGKPLISSTTGVGSGANTTSAGGKVKESKSGSKYNFKKRAIERERARHHLSSKRNKLADVTAASDVTALEEESGRQWFSSEATATTTTTTAVAAAASAAQLPPPPPPPVSSSTVSSPNYVSQQQQHQQQQLRHPSSVAAVAGPTVGETAGARGPRHSFPLPGTDTYEVFRTLSSLSGGDDFDSQSSILGSASSDNTPKHTLQAPGEDCQIIHSRGSSDCGSDLELSQNSSTAAAPPSDVYSEGENTQDNNHSHHQQQLNAFSTTTPSVPPVEVVSQSVPAAAIERQQPEERVEVLKINLAQATAKYDDATDSARRVTRNKTKHLSEDKEQQQAPPAEQPAKQLTLRVGRAGRSRKNNNNNNNNNVIENSMSEKRSRKALQQEEPDAAVATSQQTTSTSLPEVNDIITEVGEGDRDAMQQPSGEVFGVVGLRSGSDSLKVPAASATKPAATRQYSRKKKNVVPIDYVVVADTTGPAQELPLPQASTIQCPSLVTTSSTTGDMQQDVSGEATRLRQNGATRLVEQATNVGQDAGGDGGGKQEGKRIEPPLPAPPAPMRLVLQKKGTIFKSRPLVGSAVGGAADTKKRHVYKHKWDDNGNPPAGGVDGAVNGGTVAGSGTGAGVGVVGGSGVGGGGSDVGAEPGSLLQGLAVVEDAVGGENTGGCSNGGGLSSTGGIGTGSIEYDNDFDAESAPVVMASRSKRLRTGWPSTGAGAGGTVALGGPGVGGNISGGAHAGGLSGTGSCGGAIGGPSSFGHYQDCDVDSSGGGHQHHDELGGGGGDEGSRMRCDRNAKPFYTIVRNVKNSHQMQEIGEFQEMDDDVEYILSALQPDNPVSTRCLSALQLATKCMKPAFKMHVRAHGVVTRFFKSLSDAHQDASLGLCTAAIMYVFSQDKLNMDLDRDSLELMLNLLDTDHRSDAVGHTQQLQKIRQRVKELCEEIKGIGKAAKHIDTERWFKDELRNLGGIEHLIKTVAECYGRVPSGQASDWHEETVAKLRKIERCLRVLNNVSLLNRQNQRFLLEHRDGLLVQVLVKMYRQFDANLMRYPTDDASPKESTGVVLRELLKPILHMLITLTHSFDEEAYGAHLVGKQPDVINITMHLLLQIAECVPHRCVFDFHLLVLTLLLHLARPSQHNRQQVLLYQDAHTGRGGIKALVEYFEEQEEMASHAEAKTNAILETPARTVDAEDAETKLIQKAEHHMEHTYMGSHVCMLIYHLVLDDPVHEHVARLHLKNNDFRRMVAALTRYYEFLNLTTNADAESTAHKRQTKDAIDYLSRLDGCETAGGVTRSGNETTAALTHSLGE